MLSKPSLLLRKSLRYFADRLRNDVSIRPEVKQEIQLGLKLKIQKKIGTKVGQIEKVGEK